MYVPPTDTLPTNLVERLRLTSTPPLSSSSALSMSASLVTLPEKRLVVSFVFW